MNLILRAALLSALVATLNPASLFGQAPDTDSILRRTSTLERQVAALERRVAELEALLVSTPSRARTAPNDRKWRDLANWRRLNLGMKMDQVRALLGEPEKVEANVGRITWRWEYPMGPEVRFDAGSKKVEGWSEPESQ